MEKSERIIRWISHITLILFSLACIIPFIILISSSLTSEEMILSNGYNFWPAEFSLGAYEYLLNSFSRIARSYGITIFVTVVGTVTSLAITAMLAYGLSRKDLPYRNTLSFIVYF